MSKYLLKLEPGFRGNKEGWKYYERFRKLTNETGAITKDGFEYIEASIRLNIDGLRFALWQAKHDPEIRKRTGLE